MTTPMTEPPAEEVRALWTAPVVRPEPDTRLDQLAAEYAALKPLADEYRARLETIVSGIKTELAQLHPGETEVLLVGSTVPTPLRLQAVTQWRLDTKKLKAEQPNIYVRFAKQSTSWRLDQVKG